LDHRAIDGARPYFLELEGAALFDGDNAILIGVGVAREDAEVVGDEKR